MDMRILILRIELCLTRVQVKKSHEKYPDEIQDMHLELVLMNFQNAHHLLDSNKIVPTINRFSVESFTIKLYPRYPFGWILIAVSK